MADTPRTDDIPDPVPETTDILEAARRGRFGIPRATINERAMAKEWGFGGSPAPVAQSDSSYDASKFGDGSRMAMPGGSSLNIDSMLSAIDKPGPMDTGKAGGMMGTKPMPARAASPDELSAAADKMLASTRAQYAAMHSPLAASVEASRAPQSQLAGLDRQNVPPWLESYMSSQKKKK